MTRLAPFFFVFLYLVAMFRPVSPVIEYIINQDHITEFLCINKGKPQLKCNGKCYLMQMLQEQENEEEQDIPRIDLSKYPIGFFDIAIIPPQKAFDISLHASYDTIDNYSYLYYSSNYRPPTLTL